MANIIALVVLLSMTNTPNSWQHSQRTCQLNEKVYLIEYTYNTSRFMIPAVMGGGHSHYDAVIMVYEISDGKKYLVGKPFKGVYTKDGCFEDIPEELVKKALSFEEKA